jgi:Tol biopolymer transport system component
MLTGQPAFHEDSTMATMAAVLHKEPPVISAASVPRELKRILSKCLAKNPLERWQHMSDVKLLLDDVAKDFEQPDPASSSAEKPLQSDPRMTWLKLLGACAAGILLTLAWVRWAGRPQGAQLETPILRRITSDSGLSGFPAISNDGKLIAFASDRGGKGNLDLWLQQVGGEPIRLTNDPADASDPDFSPNGDSIVFRWEKDGGGIYRMPALGGTPVLLAPGGRNPHFSPNGEWIAYSMGSPASIGTAGVFLISPRGGQPRRVHPEMAEAISPVWSPRSDELIVLGRQDGRDLSSLDWWILPIDQRSPRTTGAYARIRARGLLEGFAFPQTRATPLGWRAAPEDRILFAAPLGDSMNLWELSLTGSAPAQSLTYGPGRQNYAAWSKDSGRLVFFDALLNFDLWAVPLDPQTGAARGDRQRLTDGAAWQLSPSVAADGIISYLVRRSDTDWYLQTLHKAPDTYQTLLSSQGGLMNAQIAGDGSRIYYSDRASQLFVVPAKGGISEKLCDRCGTVTGVSPDGSLALYEPFENEDLLAFDPAKRQTMKLALRQNPEDLISGAQFSADGKWVAFHVRHRSAPRPDTTMDTTQVWIAPVGMGQPVPLDQWILVSSGTGEDFNPCWSPDGRFVYFLSERDGFRCIWGRRLDPVSKKPMGEVFAVQHFHSARSSLRLTGTRGYLTGLSVGGGKLVFSLGEMTGNVWLEDPPGAR